MAYQIDVQLRQLVRSRAHLTAAPLAITLTILTSHQSHEVEGGELEKILRGRILFSRVPPIL